MRYNCISGMYIAEAANGVLEDNVRRLAQSSSSGSVNGDVCSHPELRRSTQLP